MKVPIKLSVWGRGHEEGQLFVNNENSDHFGKRCCLGFLGNACGYSDAVMEDHYLPSDCGGELNAWPDKLFEKSEYIPNSSAHQVPVRIYWELVLAYINDEESVDDELRMSWIEVGFKILFNADVEWIHDEA